jgi:hypothetical protein
MRLIKKGKNKIIRININNYEYNFKLNSKKNKDINNFMPFNVIILI